MGDNKSLGTCEYKHSLKSWAQGMSAEQISLSWIMVEGKGFLWYSNKFVKYAPNVCLIVGYKFRGSNFKFEEKNT